MDMVLEVDAIIFRIVTSSGRSWKQKKCKKSILMKVLIRLRIQPRKRNVANELQFLVFWIKRHRLILQLQLYLTNLKYICTVLKYKNFDFNVKYHRYTFYPFFILFPVLEVPVILDLYNVITVCILITFSRDFSRIFLIFGECKCVCSGADVLNDIALHRKMSNKGKFLCI